MRVGMHAEMVWRTGSSEDKGNLGGKGILICEQQRRTTRMPAPLQAQWFEGCGMGTSHLLSGLQEALHRGATI